MKTLALITLLFASSAFANDCSEVLNLNDTVNIENARSQGDIGWCYAYAMADLISHHDGREFSALGIAARYNKISLVNTIFQNKYVPEGAMTFTPVLRKVRKKGVCLEDDLSSKGLKVYRKSDLKSLLKAIDKNQNFENIEDNRFYKSVFEHMSESEIDSVSRMKTRKKSDNFFNLTERSCNKVRPQKYKVVSFKPPRPNQDNHQTKREFIDEALDDGKILLIKYDPKPLKSKASLFTLEFHASTLVGRRFNSDRNRCEYMIRNTWGKGCYGYNYDCDKGHVWVDKKFIDRYLTPELLYLK